MRSTVIVGIITVLAILGLAGVDVWFSSQNSKLMYEVKRLEAENQQLKYEIDMLERKIAFLENVEIVIDRHVISLDGPTNVKVNLTIRNPTKYDYYLFLTANTSEIPNGFVNYYISTTIDGSEVVMAGHKITEDETINPKGVEITIKKGETMTIPITFGFESTSMAIKGMKYVVKLVISWEGGEIEKDIVLET